MRRFFLQTNLNMYRFFKNAFIIFGLVHKLPNHKNHEARS